MTTQNFIVGALAGLAAGVAVGLLLAPAAGSETRQNIADGTNKLGKKIKDLAGKAGDQFTSAKNNVEEGVQNWNNNVRENAYS